MKPIQTTQPTLLFPPIFLGQNYGLEFWHRYDTEENYDGGNVKISTNNGSSWTLIYPEGGYNSTNVSALGEAGWTGTSTNWSVARFNLSEYSNQNVKFKWTLKSDNTYNGQGWFIDDVSTTGFISFGGMVGGTVVSSNPDRSLRISSSNPLQVWGFIPMSKAFMSCICPVEVTISQPPAQVTLQILPPDSTSLLPIPLSAGISTFPG
jgi:hypothetical protein